MRTNTILLNLLFVFLLLGCKNNEKNASTLEAFKKETTLQSTITNDSIADLELQINALRNSQLSKQEEIDYLVGQRDSIKNALSSITQSLTQVNSQKIAPGIQGVNAKLNELKGQRENLLEQQELKKREKALAEKRLILLSEEKIVYDQQHKNLFDKGAAPEDFVLVDSLLAGINGQINKQNSKIKSLTRKIDDSDEEKIVIDQQRTSLSTKISNNYTAKQIFDDFAKEEKLRLEAKLATIETTLNEMLNEGKDLDTKLALNTNKKSAFETKKSIADENAANASLEATINQQELEKDANKRMFALIGVGILALILALLYFLGKAKKAKQNKQL